jgi:hypothetical protein
VVAVPATLRDDAYQRLVDRLRHAEQYAAAARGMAQEALGIFHDEQKEVVAMKAMPDKRVVDQLRDAEQYAEAAVRALHDALAALEEVRKDNHDF